MPPLPIEAEVTPRPYQSDSIDAALACLREHRSVLIVLPTGTGKTIVFTLITKIGFDHDRTVLILVNRDTLIKQTVRRLRQDVGIHATVEKGKRQADPTAQVVVASVQTLSREDRLSRWNPEAFSLIVIDEAHHAVAPTYERVINHFHTAKVVGVTATPDRRDCKKLVPRMFAEVAYDMSMREAINDGWLVPIKQLFVRIKGLDYSQVRKVAGELHQGDLEAVVKNADILEKMVSSTLDYVGERPTIVFCVSKAHAHACVEFLHKAGKTAAAIDEKTPSSQRDLIEDEFRSGRIQFLCNVETMTEGFDAPETAAIAMMRPTSSRGLYVQMAGRGTRTIAGILDGLSTAKMRSHAIESSHKPQCLILDFVGNSGNHKFVHAAHALDPEADEDVVEKAEEMIAENEQLGLIEAIDLAKELVAEARKRQVISPAEHDAIEVDPFFQTDTGQTMLMFGMGRIDDPWDRAPTRPQLEALERFGVPDPDALNRKEASALLDRLIPAAKQNRATVRQMKKLMESGYPRQDVLTMTFEQASKLLGSRPISENQSSLLQKFGYTTAQLDGMTSDEASKKIDAIKANGWKRPTSDAHAG